MELLPAPFGKYFLTDKIATGGMAEIYLAKLIGPGGFEKPLIIKQIHPELSGDREFVDMFVAEAKILVSLSHGNIVPVYELGVVDDVYFIAMEFIDGPTLRTVEKALMAADTTMRPACAAFVMARVLEGLAYAHRKGVIHRDLSPRNVIISREGQVKLVDFGIAVREEHLESSKGNLVGSYPYMSPEQVRGQALSAHSDTFSAGILLWEMLTGRDLFRRADADATLRAVLEAPIESPCVHAPEVPEALEQACLRALRREPDARFESARHFLQAVQRALYADEVAVDESDLARLVARYCPPEVTRARLSTGGRERPDPEVHDARDDARDDARRSTADASTEVRAGDPGTVRIPRSPAGEHTRPLPRPPVLDTGESAEPAGDRTIDRTIGRTRPVPRRARGKRAPTVRTFATRREFQEVLERATPIIPLTAITDDEPAGAEPVVESVGAEPAAEPADDVESEAAERSSERITTSVAERASTAGRAYTEAQTEGEGWERPPLWFIALVGVALFVVIGGYVTLRSMRDAVDHKRELALRPMPGELSGPTAGSTLAPMDAGPVGDSIAARERTADQSTHGGPVDAAPAGVDARRTRAVRAHPVRERPRDKKPGDADKPGTLKVGANPWAEVHVDGKLLGRAPNSWPLPAGKHKVEVVFPVAGREQRKQFSVTIRSGAESSLGVIDFSASP